MLDFFVDRMETTAPRLSNHNQLHGCAHIGVRQLGKRIQQPDEVLVRGKPTDINQQPSVGRKAEFLSHFASALWGPGVLKYVISAFANHFQLMLGYFQVGDDFAFGRL